MGAYKVVGIVFLTLIGGLLILTAMQYAGVGPYAASSTNVNLNDQDTHNKYRIAMLIHADVNTERMKAGLKQLTYDSALAEIAQKHSEDMIAKNYFDHDSPEGIDPSDRARAASYNCFKSTHFGIAENLVKAGAKYRQYSDDDIARESVQSWMKSSGHRANILSPNYDREGIGIAFNESGNEAVITQNFC
ncbi:MAG: CAP domain-containing protein [Nitrososphaera sp.]|jgi:uncharacterized protein YkwD